MSKFCIFNKKKLCDNCGECNICDLDKNKKCNNCGECLRLEGYDTRAIKIDEIYDETEDSKDYEKLGDINVGKDGEVNEDELEFVDDIRDVEDLINEEELLGDMNIDENYKEEFPGFFTYNKKANQNKED